MSKGNWQKGERIPPYSKKCRVCAKFKHIAKFVRGSGSAHSGLPICKSCNEANDIASWIASGGAREASQ